MRAHLTLLSSVSALGLLAAPAMAQDTAEAQKLYKGFFHIDLTPERVAALTAK